MLKYGALANRPIGPQDYLVTARQTLHTFHSCATLCLIMHRKGTRAAATSHHSHRDMLCGVRYCV